ncbi:XRE family transcriptional regulator [Neolewinella xylanilytica]|uniref:XRE family transcriptional regulator n=1 Tax=Neolewinella xylanilytica TaxID=1514080 RepID=A0A2S6I784_9BACT|nr:XRE family transcriptional regulator [Neolewinella xylanilytica]PPK87376.1 XRE family transcriptional regulator [Neolewinella xylanilytica]
MQTSLLDLGPRLRSLRRRRKLSQQEVATAVGVTKGMVSKVETGRSIPTLPLLFRYLAAMECPVAEFFQDFGPAPPPPYVHQRAEAAEPIERELASRGFDYLQLLAGEGRDFALRAVLLTIEPGSRRDKVTTDAYEFKYVLAGQLDYEIGDTVLQLRPGDSLFYDGRIPHVPHNHGTEPARMLVVYLHDQLLRP